MMRSSVSNLAIGLVFYFVMVIPIWELIKILTNNPWVEIFVLGVVVYIILWVVELPTRLASWYQLKFEMITRAEYESDMSMLNWKW